MFYRAVLTMVLAASIVLPSRLLAGECISFKEPPETDPKMARLNRDYQRAYEACKHSGSTKPGEDGLTPECERWMKLQERLDLIRR